VNRKQLRQYVFKLFFAATAFTLGLASSELWQSNPAPPPPARYVTSDPALPVLSFSTPAQDMRRDEGDAREEGRYYNYDFGFSVDIPKGMVGVRPPAPMPNHGFVIDPENPQATQSN
jgi:hypothetical protein